jgi:hypothetical protein
MITAVRVTAMAPGSRRAGTAEHPVDLDLPAGPVPLRRLLAAVVRAEVAAFQARAEQRSFVRVLTERSLAVAVEQGAVRTGGDDPAADVRPDDAVRTALLAFTDGLYHVFADDRQVEELDEVLEVRPGLRLLFLRLVPLAGG